MKLGAALTDELGVFVEYVGAVSELPYESLASVGATFQATEHLQFDVGALIGLNNPSDDLTVFSGITVRF